MVRRLYERLNSLEIEQRRSVSEDYLELVFFYEQMPAWHEAVSGLLGNAVKPAGRRPSSTDKYLTSEYGGIKTDQILYHRDGENDAVTGMVWPWQDGKRATLRVIRRPGAMLGGHGNEAGGRSLVAGSLSRLKTLFFRR